MPSAPNAIAANIDAPLPIPPAAINGIETAFLLKELNTLWLFLYHCVHQLQNLVFTIVSTPASTAFFKLRYLQRVQPLCCALSNEKSN